MIDHISENALRVSTKIGRNDTGHDRAMSLQKAEEIRDARPIEKSQAGGQTEKKNYKKKEGSSRYIFNEDRIVFEKYDEHGDIILKIPRSQTPVDTLA